MQLPTYKRDIRSVLNAAFGDEIVWHFGTAASLRFTLRGLVIESVVAPSNRPADSVITSAKEMSMDFVRSMTSVGRKALETSGSRSTLDAPSSILDTMSFVDSSPTLQSQLLYWKLKEQV